MKYSAIEWTDHTFNAWIVCSKISEGCKFCYAENNKAVQSLGLEWGPGKPRHRTSELNWKQPLEWDKEAEQKGIRYRVFTNSLADVFDEEVEDDWRFDLFQLIARTPNLDWLLLTKRPEVAAQPEYKEALGLLQNVWVGVSVENQRRAEERIPILKTIPAKVRFLSCEPLLESVSLAHHLADGEIHWVIVGGESSNDGVSARPMEKDWVRELRDECVASNTAFFFKQWGGKTTAEKYQRGSMLDARKWQQFPIQGPEMKEVA